MGNPFRTHNGARREVLRVPDLSIVNLLFTSQVAKETWCILGGNIGALGLLLFLVPSFQSYIHLCSTLSLFRLLASLCLLAQVPAASARALSFYIFRPRIEALGNHKPRQRLLELGS